MNEELKNAIDPMGLLAEPTAEEMKEWENSEFFSDNPYVLIGFLVNHRKRRMEKELEGKFKLKKVPQNPPVKNYSFKLPNLKN